jgi:hypothetical protein
MLDKLARPAGFEYLCPEQFHLAKTDHSGSMEDSYFRVITTTLVTVHDSGLSE